MGTIRDIARLGKATANVEQGGADGFLWFIYIFGGIIIFFILLKAFIKYKINKLK